MNRGRSITDPSSYLSASSDVDKTRIFYLLLLLLLLSDYMKELEIPAVQYSTGHIYIHIYILTAHHEYY